MLEILSKKIFKNWKKWIEKKFKINKKIEIHKFQRISVKIGLEILIINFTQIFHNFFPKFRANFRNFKIFRYFSSFLYQFNCVLQCQCKKLVSKIRRSYINQFRCNKCQRWGGGSLFFFVVLKYWSSHFHTYFLEVF